GDERRRADPAVRRGGGARASGRVREGASDGEHRPIFTERPSPPQPRLAADSVLGAVDELDAGRVAVAGAHGGGDAVLYGALPVAALPIERESQGGARPGAGRLELDEGAEGLLGRSQVSGGEVRA